MPLPYVGTTPAVSAWGAVPIVVIPLGGTIPTPLPTLGIVIEQEA